MQQPVESDRTEQGERLRAVVEVIGLQQAGQAEAVIQVEVGQIELVELNQTGRKPQLALGTLAAVEHQTVTAASHQHARGTAKRGRHRPAGSEKGDREIHCP